MTIRHDGFAPDDNAASLVDRVVLLIVGLDRHDAAGRLLKNLLGGLRKPRRRPACDEQRDGRSGDQHEVLPA